MNDFYRKKLSASFLLAAALSAAAMAEETMDTVVVTATRTEQPLKEVLASTSVVTREDIERLQPRDLGDLLHREAGLDITRTGGVGSTSGLLLRGAASNQTVFLVDGVRINTNSNGAATLELIDLEQVERIEIVRGPVSSLYGNDAIGGVVQIFTRRNDGAPVTTVKAGWGSHATSRQSINHGGRIDDFHYNVTASGEEAGGIDATNRDNFAHNADDEDYRNHGLAATMGYDFAGNHSVSVTARRNEGQAEFDNGEMNFDTQSVSANAALQLTDNIRSSLRLSQFEDQQDTPAFASVFDTRRNEALWQTDISSGDINTFTTGVEYSYDELDTNQGYTDDERRNRALFLQDLVKLGRHAFQLGLRHDDNTQYGSEKTWNINYGFDIDEQMTVFTNYGTAFKAPTFNDLYFPYTDFCAGFGFICASVGNPDLQPEWSRSFEVGLKGEGDTFHWSSSVYKTNISNLVVWMPFFGPGMFDSTWRPENVDDAVIHGLDLTGGIDIGKWRFNSTATLLNPQDANSGDRLIRRSKRKLTIEADYALNEHWSAGMSWLAQGGRVDRGNGADQYLGGYNTVDLRTSYSPVEQLDLTLTLGNVFDRDYTLAYGYETEGATVMLTAAYTF